MENTLKNQIKTMSEEQTFLKNQRKSVFIVGERKLSTSEAAFKHFQNRQGLKARHIAYAILREKDPASACNNYENLLRWERKHVEKIVDEHKAFFAERKAKWEAAQAAYESRQQQSA